MSSTETYKSGRFDEALLRMLERFDEVQAIMLPSLREERAATYSPFLPIHPRTGIVMQAPVLGHDARAGTIRWRDPATAEEFETPVTGGKCKLQWKPDWAMRWYALGVDYEMAGKDLIDSVKLSSRIARVLGAEPPAGFNYELFLDENGQKISKSKGNGLTIEEWLAYASPESLSLFMFQKPTAAKRLYFDVIPRTVDDYLGFLEAYPRQEWKERLGNPAWHIHAGAPPAARGPRPRRDGAGDDLFRHAAQSRDRRQYRQPFGSVGVSAALRALGVAGDASASRRPGSLRGRLFSRFRRAQEALSRGRRGRARRSRADLGQARELPAGASADDIQHALYDIARPIPRYQDHSAKGATPARPGVSNDFFNMIYAVLLGEARGPRLGSFIALYGLEETRALIDKALAGDFARETRRAPALSGAPALGTERGC